MTKRRKIVSFLVVLLVISGLAYSPTVLYLFHVMGFGIARAELEEIHFEFEKWWFPVFSPDSLVERVFGKSKKNSLIFLQANGVLPSASGTVFISRIPVNWEPSNSATKIELSIGDAYDVTDAADTTGLKHFVVKSHALLFTVDSIDSLRAIKRVKIIRDRPRLNRD